jgi:diguanylate cyclase (GGDEF)-like protein
VREYRSAPNPEFVNGVQIQCTPLTPGDRLQIGAQTVLQYGSLDDAEDELLRNLYTASTHDSLTGTFNRRYFFDRLAIEISHARRHSAQLSVMVLDVDHFKVINDTHGHAAGDAFLRSLAATLSQRVRAEDVFARYGGEEFAMLVRDTPRVLAHLFAERIRLQVEALRVPHAKALLRATLSIGLAELEEAVAVGSSEELLVLADRRLYQAKALGRNRVCSGGD